MFDTKTLLIALIEAIANSQSGFVYVGLKNKTRHKINVSEVVIDDLAITSTGLVNILTVIDDTNTTLLLRADEVVFIDTEDRLESGDQTNLLISQEVGYPFRTFIVEDPSELKYDPWSMVDIMPLMYSNLELQKCEWVDGYLLLEGIGFKHSIPFSSSYNADYLPTLILDSNLIHLQSNKLFTIPDSQVGPVIRIWDKNCFTDKNSITISKDAIRSIRWVIRATMVESHFWSLSAYLEDKGIDSTAVTAVVGSLTIFEYDMTTNETLSHQFDFNLKEKVSGWPAITVKQGSMQYSLVLTDNLNVTLQELNIPTNHFKNLIVNVTVTLTII